MDFAACRLFCQLSPLKPPTFGAYPLFKPPFEALRAAHLYQNESWVPPALWCSCDHFKSRVNDICFDTSKIKYRKFLSDFRRSANIKVVGELLLYCIMCKAEHMSIYLWGSLRQIIFTVAPCRGWRKICVIFASMKRYKSFFFFGLFFVFCFVLFCFVFQFHSAGTYVIK